MAKSGHDTVDMRFVWGGLLFALIVLAFFYSVSAILMPFITGLVGAYIFNGLVAPLERMKVSRGIGSALVILAFIVILITVILVAFPFVQRQLFFIVKSLPEAVEQGFQFVAPLLEKAAEEIGTPSVESLKAELMGQLGNVIKWLVGFFSNLVQNSMALANIISLVFLTPVVMFYLLKDWPLLVEKLDSYLPTKSAPKIRAHVREIHKNLSAYAKGQALVCLTLMALYAVALGLIGLHQGVFIGLLTGFFSFVPYVGTLIGFLISIWVGFTQYTDWIPILTIVAAFIAINTFEANFLVPRLVGERIGVHPVWVIFALLASAVWFGFVGMLIALPLATVIGVLVRSAMKWYKTSTFYQGMKTRAKTK